MILITLGNHTQPFDRIVEWVERLPEEIQNEIVIQLGETKRVPKRGRAFAFTTSTELADLALQSRWYVCHAGVGSLLLGMRLGVPTICVPRRAMYGEHVDDHQLEIAQVLGSAGKVRVVEEFTAFADALGTTPPARAPEPSAGQLPVVIAETLRSIALQRGTK